MIFYWADFLGPKKRIEMLRIYKHTFKLLLLLLITACSSNGSVDIELPKGMHLEDTTAGSFLKILDIDYDGNLSFIGEIRKALKRNAGLEDEYIEGKNKVVVRRWRVLSSRNKRSFILYEKIAPENNIWFEYPLGGEGVPYAALIGEKAKDLKSDRKYEGSVYISSKADNARLVLFGFGNYCTSVVILGGA
ncbi:MAG: hypothetical protein HY889_02110 [Deltaproteobacteria bacterium]|nr:hypothetical protein [Deltaproteobacteria bacterium]